ncbi:hypothetical protein BJY16_007406 [Actinoplanes octamycinicus]|uniref:Uncharacterized protein n=1 Tax=Actinoplanes octamycinicus TaxID=135948 RepID=A0A7W7H5D4_9ACTN|nr:hypothetical protein [Actinoplanes octamycinicus]MBB4743947.1 hypothetical protein [Actinoplanes octamycinicus]
MSSVQADRDDVAAAAAVLDATATACREYEVGAHGALRIARALEEAVPGSTTDLADDLSDEQSAYERVQPEAVGEVVAEVAERLQAAVEDPPAWRTPAASGYRPMMPGNAVQDLHRSGAAGA